MIEIISPAKNVKTRKAYQCQFCFGEIQKGSTSIYGVFKYEGEIYSWRTHVKCSKIADHLDMYDSEDEGLTGERFCERIEEEFLELNSNLDEDTGIEFEEMLNFVIKHHNLEVIE